VTLPVPERYPDGFLPVVPVTGRNQTAVVYEIDQRTTYVQNFNIELQRELMNNLTLEVRYIATKGTKLGGNININSPIVVENGLTEAVGVTRAGGDAPLFDQMLNGLSFAGIGTVGVNGLTGSSALRRFSGTRGDIANGDVVGVAQYLNTNSSFTGEVGGMIRNGGLPENFIVANPQFGNANVEGARNNSTYHSMQLGVTKRLSNGFANQTTYTWSRSIGDRGNIDPRNRGLNKALLANHRTHDIRSNGTWELPFGPGRMFLDGTPSWVARVVEGWQFGGIFRWTSGAPLTIQAGENPFTTGSNVADVVGSFPKNIGELVASETPGSREYLLGFQRVDDPAEGLVTTSDTLRSAYSRMALADASGNIVVQHAPYGAYGNLGQAWFEGPGSYDVDMNLMKRVRIDESKVFVLRLDALSVLNHPNWGNPNVNLNSGSFGLVSLPTSGNRQFTFNLRLEFN
jgi:hypothetical protein